MREKEKAAEYAKECPLLALFQDHGARHCIGTPAQQRKKEDQRELIEKLAKQHTQGFVIITPDGDHHGTVEAFVWNSRDSLLTMVIRDDNGHTVVLQDMASLKEFDEELEEGGGLWLGVPSDYKRKLDKVHNMYRGPGGFLDGFAMAERLVELGEGD